MIKAIKAMFSIRTVLKAVVNTFFAFSPSLLANLKQPVSSPKTRTTWSTAM